MIRISVNIPHGARAGARWLILVLCMLYLVSGTSWSQVVAAQRDAERTFPEHGALRIDLHDDIQSPLYSWPRTLLSYRVDFHRRSIRTQDLRFKQDGEPSPFQLSKVKTTADGHLTFARVNFFSDLQPGASHVFTLEADGGGSQPARFKGVTATAEGRTLTVDAGALQVRLPATQQIAPGQTVPGPILALNRGQGWIGNSRLLSGEDRVLRVKTDRLESGGLFATYRIRYEFARGGSYTVLLKAVLDYPFVDFSEEMTGLPLEQGTAVEMDWTSFHPSRRFAANGRETMRFSSTGIEEPENGLPIDKPVTTTGIIEEPRWIETDYVEDPAKEMLFRLSAFAGNAPREAVPAMSFWETGTSGQELGVFVPDTKAWDDQQYDIWQTSTRLDVRFRFANGNLVWHWPLVSGTRRTGIAFSSVQDGEEQNRRQRELYAVEAKGFRDAFLGKGAFSQASVYGRYAQWLRSWFGALNLDRVKDWILEYPADPSVPKPFPYGKGAADLPAAGQTVDDLLRYVHHSILMDYPLGLNVGVVNLDHYQIAGILERYLQLNASMTERQRRQLNALILLSAYINTGDDLAPVRACLTGTPNMSSDSFSLPAAVSMLFPHHPMITEWREQFEKTIELQAKFYTRPAVAAYGSLGGRWAESLATYNNAYFSSTLDAQVALKASGDHIRIANREMAQRGEWMVDELSAPIYNPDPYWRQGLAKQPPPSPWKQGLALTPQNAFERQWPAHGAHGTGTGQVISTYVPMLGKFLEHYDPMVSEHLLWAYAQRTSKNQGEFDEPFWQAGVLKQVQGNPGTNPHLKSSKYTGHGIILRAGVGTPEEVSVHLDQTDQGPNYRWGNNGEGSSGVLYFYAAGRPWAGHERENTGDHSNDTATGTTTFAAIHGKEWRSIGENVLERPLFDLGVAQFGTITARHDHLPYAWPAYRSRSVMLVGTDYMILGDDADGETRFSWFTARDLSFPKLIFLEPETARPDHWAQVSTPTSKGIVRDALGASIVLVTHKPDVEMEAMKHTPLKFPDVTTIEAYTRMKTAGDVPTPGVWLVSTPVSHDRVFRNFSAAIDYRHTNEAFSGRAGVIRTRTDGTTEFALFEGTSIAAAGLTVLVDASADAAVSARIAGGGEVVGEYDARRAAAVEIASTNCVRDCILYLDGQRMQSMSAGQFVTLKIPQGHHHWQITKHLPIPLQPVITATKNLPGGVEVRFPEVAGAQDYRIETSTDGGVQWSAATSVKASPAVLRNLVAGAKVHVRVVARNADAESLPSDEYPVYVSNQRPAPPDGLSLVLAQDKISAAWGEVLGASAYLLYRRQVGTEPWTRVYSGPRSDFEEFVKGVQPAAKLPGREDNSGFDPASLPIYEYAVATLDGNGESDKSPPVSTDPTNWLNWWPQGVPRRFKRQTAFWQPPYVPAEMTPPMYYPGDVARPR